MRVARVSLVCLVALLIAPKIHAAQNDRIFMTVDGVSCSSPGGGKGQGMAVTAWQFGASNAVNIGSGTSGAGAGKAKFEPFTINRVFDECSTLLLPKLFEGAHVAKVTLTQYSANSEGESVPLMIVTLSTVFFTDYMIGGNDKSEPSETWSLTPAKVCIKNAANNAEACWDVRTNSTN